MVGNTDVVRKRQRIISTPEKADPPPLNVDSGELEDDINVFDDEYPQMFRQDVDVNTDENDDWEISPNSDGFGKMRLTSETRDGILDDIAEEDIECDYFVAAGVVDTN